VEKIQDSSKTDPLNFIYGVNCEMKRIQDSLKVDPAMNFIDV
jgi:hypothetical protein